MSTQSSNDDLQNCPLCMEEMDLTDKQFQPCKCGYQICLWCWHQVREVAAKENTEAKCPACRRPYDKSQLQQQQIRPEELPTNSGKGKKKEKSKDRAQKTADRREADATKSRKHLANVRVIQRNLVYVIGLPLHITREDILRRKEYFGQYGKIVKVATNRSSTFSSNSNGPSASAYVTFAKSDDALRCIAVVDGAVMEGRVLRACFGTTKYCNAFLKGLPCNNPDCLYLHEVGNEEDSYTKEEMVARNGAKVASAVGKVSVQAAASATAAAAAAVATSATQAGTSSGMDFHEATHPGSSRATIHTENGLPPPAGAHAQVTGASTQVTAGPHKAGSGSHGNGRAASVRSGKQLPPPLPPNPPPAGSPPHAASAGPPGRAPLPSQPPLPQYQPSHTVLTARVIQASSHHIPPALSRHGALGAPQPPLPMQAGPASFAARAAAGANVDLPKNYSPMLGNPPPMTNDTAQFPGLPTASQAPRSMDGRQNSGGQMMPPVPHHGHMPPPGVPHGPANPSHAMAQQAQMGQAPPSHGPQQQQQSQPASRFMHQPPLPAMPPPHSAEVVNHYANGGQALNAQGQGMYSSFQQPGVGAEQRAVTAQFPNGKTPAGVRASPSAEALAQQWPQPMGDMNPNMSTAIPNSQAQPSRKEPGVWDMPDLDFDPWDNNSQMHPQNWPATGQPHQQLSQYPEQGWSGQQEGMHPGMMHPGPHLMGNRLVHAPEGMNGGHRPLGEAMPSTSQPPSSRSVQSQGRDQRGKNTSSPPSRARQSRFAFAREEGQGVPDSLQGPQIMPRRMPPGVQHGQIQIHQGYPEQGWSMSSQGGSFAMSAPQNGISPIMAEGMQNQGVPPPPGFGRTRSQHSLQEGSVDEQQQALQGLSLGESNGPPVARAPGSFLPQQQQAGYNYFQS